MVRSSTVCNGLFVAMFSEMPRGRERDSVLRVRRRAKLERDIAAFCTGGGVSIEIARC
jgi:hypothetical protein